MGIGGLRGRHLKYNDTSSFTTNGAVEYVGGQVTNLSTSGAAGIVFNLQGGIDTMPRYGDLILSYQVRPYLGSTTVYNLSGFTLDFDSGVYPAVYHRMWSRVCNTSYMDRIPISTSSGNGSLIMITQVFRNVSSFSRVSYIVDSSGYPTFDTVYPRSSGYALYLGWGQKNAGTGAFYSTLDSSIFANSTGIYSTPYSYYRVGSAVLPTSTQALPSSSIFYGGTPDSYSGGIMYLLNPDYLPGQTKNSGIYKMNSVYNAKLGGV